MPVNIIVENGSRDVIVENYATGPYPVYQIANDTSSISYPIYKEKSTQVKDDLPSYTQVAEGLNVKNSNEQSTD